MNKPLEELVKYLVKPFKTNLEIIRVLFRWLCSRKLSELPNLKSEMNECVLAMLCDLRDDKLTYAQLYHDMCG